MGKEDEAAASPMALVGPTGRMAAGAADTGGGKGPGASDGRHDELPLIVQGLLSLRSPSVTPAAAAKNGGAGAEGPMDAAKTRPGARFGAMVMKEDSDGGSTMSVASSDGEARVTPLSPPEGSQPATTVCGRQCTHMSLCACVRRGPKGGEEDKCV